MIQLPWLDPTSIEFPQTSQALSSPNGLLAAGGELSPEWLLKAYSQGIFPWFSEGEPILWWSPSPRTVLYIDQLHVSKSLQKALRKNQTQNNIKVRFDKAFEEVIRACAKPRTNEADSGTWISEEMIEAYTLLHDQGYAHSVEIWENEELIGGLYGIALGRMFFGESMFSFKTNSSKFALFYLVEKLKEWQYTAIDCQVHNDHLASLGATEVPREEFEGLIEQYVSDTPCHWGNNNKTIQR